MNLTIADHAATTPDKPAVIMARSGEVVTYRELNDQSNKAAQMFRSVGMTAGDSIAILLENHPRFAEICWAAQRTGLYYTAISSMATAEEAAYIIGDCGAKLFFSSAAKSEAAAQLVGQMPGVERRYMLDGAIEGYESYDASVADHPARPVPDETQGRDMLYSSGTTGRPKGVRRLYPEAPFGTPEPLHDILTTIYGFDRDSIYLSPGPLYHAAPLRYNLGVHKVGGTNIVMERFDAEEALRLIEQWHVTHSQWVPTMFVRILKLPEDVRARYDLSSLKVAIHAAAPCPIPVKEQMIDWWGPIIYEYYAGTEGNGYCAIDSEEWLTRKGSVGSAKVGVLHILDEGGQEQPPGEPGAIYFSDGPTFKYHNDADKTAGAHTGQGWSTLGDIGYVDEDGYLFLTDRKAHMIISGGVNIYPQELENLLITHPKVLDAAVIGVPDADYGEAVKAVIQPADMADADADLESDLFAFCRKHLSAVKCPKSFDFAAELPRHPNGKLLKRLLRDRYWQDHESRII